MHVQNVHVALLPISCDHYCGLYHNADAEDYLGNNAHVLFIDGVMNNSDLSGPRKVSTIMYIAY